MIAESRNTDLAKIHLGAKQLGLDDGTYRQMIKTLCGADSAADLDAAGRRKVLAHMASNGAIFTRQGVGRRPNNLVHGDLHSKIEAQLSDMGLSWRYAEAILERMRGFSGAASGKTANPVSGASRAEMLRIVGALSAEQEKRQLIEGVDAELQRRRSTREGLAQLCGFVPPKGWERNRPALKRIWQALYGERFTLQNHRRR
jgi:hypothetical protein